MLRQLKRLFDGSRTYRRFGGVEESLVGTARILLHRPNQRLRRRRWESLKGRGALVANVDGVKLKLNPGDAGLSAELALYGRHEPHATSLLLAQVTRGMTILDVGANLGYYAIQESVRVGPTGRVIAVEPAPVTFALLRENAALNECHNVELHQAAVSDKAGEADLYVGAHANVSRLGERPDYIDKVTVPTHRIDDLLAHEPHLDIIRMDIEGHEIHALPGMLDTIDRYRPLVCVEFHFPLVDEDDARQFFSSFDARDYEVGCFVFRFSDEIMFGRTLGRRSQVYKSAPLNELADGIRSENTILFLQPAERPIRRQ